MFARHSFWRFWFRKNNVFKDWRAFLCMIFNEEFGSIIDFTGMTDFTWAAPPFRSILSQKMSKISKFQNFLFRMHFHDSKVMQFEFSIKFVFWFVAKFQNFMHFQNFKIFGLSSGECFAPLPPPCGGCHKSGCRLDFAHFVKTFLAMWGRFFEIPKFHEILKLVGG